MSLEKIVHTALDELRMQMLGTQVLFGFQLQSVFQDSFAQASVGVRFCDLLALSFLVLTLGLLIAGPAQHRLVEQGQATRRILRVANRFAEFALASLALAFGLDVFVIATPHFGDIRAAGAGVLSVTLAVALWFGLGLVLRPFFATEVFMPELHATKLHEKIDQMLTEARVILPGAQALFGFQFIVTMSKGFAALPASVQALHFAALAAISIAIVLLIAPAAVHRLTFRGQDREAVHDIGSMLVTAALIPLALGIAGDVFVAVSKITGSAGLSSGAAGSALILLLLLWYAVPLWLRSRGEALRT